MRNGRYELDQVDDESAIYLVVTDHDGNHPNSARLLETPGHISSTHCLRPVRRGAAARPGDPCDYARLSRLRASFLAHAEHSGASGEIVAKQHHMKCGPMCDDLRRKPDEIGHPRGKQSTSWTPDYICNRSRRIWWSGSAKLNMR